MVPLLLWLTFVGPNVRKQVTLSSLDVRALTAVTESEFKSQLADASPDALKFTSEWAIGGSMKVRDCNLVSSHLAACVQEYTITDANIELLGENAEVKVYHGAPSMEKTCSENDKGCADTSKFQPPIADMYEVISESPRIYYFPNFLSGEECDDMINLGKVC